MGVILDSRLTWKENLSERIRKAQKVYFVCQKPKTKPKTCILDLRRDSKVYYDVRVAFNGRPPINKITNHDVRSGCLGLNTTNSMDACKAEKNISNEYSKSYLSAANWQE